MKIACGRCGKIHEHGQCSIKVERKEYRGKIKRFRSSALWVKKRKEILERDAYQCRLCLHEGRITVHKQLEVHHIEPLTADFDQRLDDDNLITLCKDCHYKADKGIVGKDTFKKILKAPLAQLSEL